jgi:hypothetical protein
MNCDCCGEYVGTNLHEKVEEGLKVKGVILCFLCWDKVKYELR